MGEAVERYLRLRGRTDRRAAELIAMHGPRIVCRPDCCDCCTNLTVFPVEYRAILDELREAGTTRLAFDPRAACGFLQAGLCALYPHRPLICRTHGLPIAFAGDDGPPTQRSVSFCPRNFAQAGDVEPTFGPDNTLDLDALNDELFEINLRFLGETPDPGPGPTGRIPLVRLCDDLANDGNTHSPTS